MKAQITLTPEEVQDIIKQHLSEKYEQLVIGEVKFDIGKIFKGGGRDEYSITILKGIICDVEI